MEVVGAACPEVHPWQRQHRTSCGGRSAASRYPSCVAPGDVETGNSGALTQSQHDDALAGAPDDKHAHTKYSHSNLACYCVLLDITR